MACSVRKVFKFDLFYILFRISVKARTGIFRIRCQIQTYYAIKFPCLEKWVKLFSEIVLEKAQAFSIWFIVHFINLFELYVFTRFFLIRKYKTIESMNIFYIKSRLLINNCHILKILYIIIVVLQLYLHFKM